MFEEDEEEEENEDDEDKAVTSFCDIFAASDNEREEEDCNAASGKRASHCNEPVVKSSRLIRYMKKKNQESIINQPKKKQIPQKCHLQV